MKIPKSGFGTFKTKVPKPRTKPTGISSSFGATRPSSMFGAKQNYAKKQPQDPMDLFATPGGAGFSAFDREFR
jgi:hypothetical protein